MNSRHSLRHLACLACTAFVALTAAPSEAHAFCGFYVAPNDQPLYADATMVALMRDGTRTVLSMSNNYKGPAADFAMVVPVPVVLQKENVKTLPMNLFEKLEKLSAPRLVEYWEQDPCAPELDYDEKKTGGSLHGMGAIGGAAKEDDGYGVKVEAKFTVGEYDVVVLSAKDSDGLYSWLKDNKYNIPAGAPAALDPYIKSGQKFFVAKVDITKVTRDAAGVAVLSPLRFNYESTEFRLPVRLGLINAKGKQDLIVYVLAKDHRYETTNYPNAFIPTNLDVSDATRAAFSPFYARLFDATIAKAGGKAVVTEYSWASGSCDPCPTPPLEDSDVATLGGDVLFGMGAAAPTDGSSGSAKEGYYGGTSQQVVLTRLHARYDATTLTDDLIFREADAVVGGREYMTEVPPSGATGADAGDAAAAPTYALEKGARKDTENNFQARYVIRHPWTGPIACATPRRGNWGGPWPAKDGSYVEPPATATATKLAGASRDSIRLPTYVTGGMDDVAAYENALLSVSPTSPKSNGAAAKEAPRAGSLLPAGPQATRACNCDLRRQGGGTGAFGASAIAALTALSMRRRARKRPRA